MTLHKILLNHAPVKKTVKVTYICTFVRHNEAEHWNWTTPFYHINFMHNKYTHNNKLIRIPQNLIIFIFINFINFYIYINYRILSKK